MTRDAELPERFRRGMLVPRILREQFPYEPDFPFARWHKTLSPPWTAEEVKEKESELVASPEYLKYRNDPTFGEVRGYDPNVSPWMRLMEDPTLQPVTSYVFQNEDLTEIVCFCYPSPLACGRNGALHGGYIAQMLDDMSGAITVVNRGSLNLCMTAYIKVEYKAPSLTKQWLKFSMKLGRHEGRKWFQNGKLEDLSGKLLVQSEALMVEIKASHF